MVQTWDTNNVSADVTFSNGNLTVAANTVNNNHMGFATTSAPSSSKKYWETQVNGFNDSAGDSPGIGLGNTTTVVTLGNYLGFDTTCVGYYMGLGGGSGDLFYNNTNQGFSLEAYLTGDIVCHALDLVNNSYFVRRNGGNWMNNGSANPSTNTGGWSIPSSITNNPVLPGFTLYFAVGVQGIDSVVAQFAQSSWSFTPPSGFGPFDVTAIPMGQTIFRLNRNTWFRVKSIFMPPKLGWISTTKKYAAS